jgi:hypothetical protein
MYYQLVMKLFDKKSFLLIVIWFILLWRRIDNEESFDVCSLYNKIMNLTGEVKLYGLFYIVLFLQIIIYISNYGILQNSIINYNLYQFRKGKNKNYYQII